MGRLLLAAALVLGFAVTSVPAQAAATTVTTLQLNLCHSGVNTSCFTGDDVIDRAVAVIEAEQPQVLSVNEACSGDVATLRTAMGRSTVSRFVAAERPDGSAVTCTNGQSYGNIIMVIGSLAGSGYSGIYEASIQDSGSERRAWTCLEGDRLTACSTHLSASDAGIALQQCQALVGRAASRTPAIVSGDMNLRYGGTTDAQDCNRTGFYRKGDGSLQHVFASTGLSFVSSEVISMAGTTDHDALLVTTTLA